MTVQADIEAAIVTDVQARLDATAPYTAETAIEGFKVVGPRGEPSGDSTVRAMIVFDPAVPAAASFGRARNAQGELSTGSLVFEVFATPAKADDVAEAIEGTYQGATKTFGGHTLRLGLQNTGRGPGADTVADAVQLPFVLRR